MPAGREPASVVEDPTDQEIEDWANSSDDVPGVFLDPDSGRWERCLSSEEFCSTVRTVLARWGTPNLTQVRSSLGDGPAVPAGREPASVVEDPTDQEIEDWANSSDDVPGVFLDPDSGRWERCLSSEEFCSTVRTVLARWGR